MDSQLELAPEKLSVSFRGTPLLYEGITLADCGVRTDDEVVVEFVSPVCPPVLTLLRKPDPPGGAKKGKGGGKGKKKK